jgi:E3 ubiquitin-protein ligase CHFR
VIELEDLSTNGTFVNGTKVGKGNRQALRNGDEISLLPASRATAVNKVKYKIMVMTTVVPGAATAAPATAKPSQSAATSTPSKQAKVDKSISDEMTCGICIEVIHECVTLMPCLHNFCGGCFSDWMKRSQQCPKCRDPVSEARRNVTLNNIIDAYLKSHPEEKRDAAELKRLSEANKIT